MLKIKPVPDLFKDWGNKPATTKEGKKEKNSVEKQSFHTSFQHRFDIKAKHYWKNKWIKIAVFIAEVKV